MMFFWFILRSDDFHRAEVEATGLAVPAPPLPGKWTLFALLLSPAPGRRLQFSPPASISVFRPVEVEFRLAPSINVGESLEVDVKIGNNVNSCVDVSFTHGVHCVNQLVYLSVSNVLPCWIQFKG